MLQFCLPHLPHPAHSAVVCSISEYVQLSRTERLEELLIAASRTGEYKDLFKQHRPGQERAEDQQEHDAFNQWIGLLKHIAHTK